MDFDNDMIKILHFFRIGENIMRNTLTSRVLTAAYRSQVLRDTAIDAYCWSLLASYADSASHSPKDTPYLVLEGKRIIPKSIVRHYAEYHTDYPVRLYTDIKVYYDDVASYHDAVSKHKLHNNLSEVLQVLPDRDRKKISTLVEQYTDTLDGTCLLYAALLYYAFHADLYQYHRIAA